MKLATVLTPMTDHHLRLAAQCGVQSVVSRYPGTDLADVLKVKHRVASFGLELAVIEGYLPIENIKLGIDDGREIEALRSLVQQMGEAEIPLLCYNFMSGTDWVRTQLRLPARGGATVTGFRLSDVHSAISLGQSETAVGPSPHSLTVDEPKLWSNLTRLLEQLLPVAERSGVTLAMHPDDPPLAQLQGRARIMNSVESFERLVRLAPSAHNAICFCQGTFAAMGVNIPETIRRLGRHIKYVHFRDVAGTAESFVETFHDNGPTDMVAAMQAYHEIGFNGPIRPDHVPQLDGESDGEPGYTMQGRLFAFGYLRGLMQATAGRNPSDD